MAITKTPFGAMPRGQAVDCYTLENAAGMRVRIATYGGAILSIETPDGGGTLGDVTLGYDTLDALRAAGGYMGVLVGRFANRIANGRFTLDGMTYALAQNDGVNHLHGGLSGFDKKVWDASVANGALVLRIISPDGEEHYPGTLRVTVTYTLGEDNTLAIRYEAETDKPTIVNLTNHAYFNLSGPACETVNDHEICIHADRFTAVDSGSIPTGELRDVTGTPFDLRAFTRIADRLARQAADEQMAYGKGFDHNFVPRGAGMREAAVLRDPASRRRMTVCTDQPGIQFYGGNMISGDVPGKCGVPYRARQGLCLETQHYPDAVNHPAFPTCVLRPGERYDTTTTFRFDCY